MTVVPATADAWVDQNDQGTNHGQKAKLWLNGGGGTDQRYAFLFFARPFGFAANVHSAILRFYLAEDWAGALTVTAKRVTEPWQENRVNWNNRPGVDGANAATTAAITAPADTEIELDVTDMMGDVAQGADWFGFRLELSGDNMRAIRSVETADAELRPTLELEWSEAPEAPADLTPSGGSAVSLEYPVLSWRFSDLAGEFRQASSQVQINDSDDFSGAVDHDTGKVANGLEQWDLDDDVAFGGVPADAVRYWRVRVWDEADIASEWSDVQEFTRKTHGALTITNPPAPDPSTVEETTPPIAWTFTGRTQESFAYHLHEVDPDDGSIIRPLYGEGQHVSTDTEATLHAGHIRSGRTYRVELKVWDDIDRQVVRGDPDYVAASRTFTYEHSLDAPDSVTGLTATPDGPKVVLEIERSATPDFFCLVVDGEEVEDRIDPADLEVVSPGVWRYEYWGAQPVVEHTYEVEAVMNDLGVQKHSTGNATATARTNPSGIWLADPDDGVAARIDDRQPLNLDVGEAAETFYPKGSRRPVRVTEGLRGFEGDGGGVLLSKAHRDNFLALRGRPGRTLRLILGDLNIPVELEAGVPVPTPTPTRDVWEVSFAFFQVDEFFEAAGA
jgi:hypothetical protein